MTGWSHPALPWGGVAPPGWACTGDRPVVDHPHLRQVVLDAVDARALAEFYRQLLGLRYRFGDEPPSDDGPDVQAGEWLALRDAAGLPVLAVQPVPTLPRRRGRRGRRGRCPRCCTSI